MSVPDAAATASAVVEEVLSAVVADETVVEEVVAGVLARGHVLLEDVPDTGSERGIFSIINQWVYVWVSVVTHYTRHRNGLS